MSQAHLPFWHQSVRRFKEQEDPGSAALQLLRSQCAVSIPFEREKEKDVNPELLLQSNWAQIWV